MQGIVKNYQSIGRSFVNLWLEIKIMQIIQSMQALDISVGAETIIMKQAVKIVSLSRGTRASHVKTPEG